MIQATPFLLFDGNCAEAMNFYNECLGGKLTMTRLGDTAMKESFPKEKYGSIINSQLISDGINISATDWMASPEFDPILGNMSAVYITSQSTEELKTLFAKLAEGAKKEWFQDLHEMPFGLYGQFFDKFGVQWIFKGDR
ncbi:MAG: VOC family protein [Candidatus Dojkabacteria bacterium]